MFCFLAVTVLALGICGVSTQFTIVNAFTLGGFSFPHPGTYPPIIALRAE